MARSFVLNALFSSAVLVALVGWTPATLAELRGKTAADAKLASDAYRDFVTVAGAHMTCSSIDFAEVVDSKVSGNVADEVWIATGCGKALRFAVRFEPAPQGGYNYKISPLRQSQGAPGTTGRDSASTVITSVDKLNALQPGETTAEFVRANFGEPVSEDRNPDGRFVYLYPFTLPIKGDAAAAPMKGMVAFLFGSDSKLIRLRLYEDKGR